MDYMTDRALPLYLEGELQSVVDFLEVLQVDDEKVWDKVTLWRGGMLGICAVGQVVKQMDTADQKFDKLSNH